MRAKIFSQTGAMMSQATSQLAQACRLRHEASSTADEDEATFTENLYNERKEAVGDEMAGILELLGEVRVRYPLFG